MPALVTRVLLVGVLQGTVFSANYITNDSQDPQKLEKYDMSTFYHIKEKIKLVDEEDEEAKKSSTYTLKSTRFTESNNVTIL